MARKLELLDISVTDIRKELEEQLDRDSIVALCIEAGVDESDLQGLEEPELIELFLEKGNLEELMGRILGIPAPDGAQSRSGESDSRIADGEILSEDSECADEKSSAEDSGETTVHLQLADDSHESLEISKEDLKAEMTNYWSETDLADIAASFNLEVSDPSDKEGIIDFLISSVSVNQIVGELMNREAVAEDSSQANVSADSGAESAAHRTEDVDGVSSEQDDHENNDQITEQVIEEALARAATERFDVESGSELSSDTSAVESGSELSSDTPAVESGSELSSDTPAVESGSELSSDTPAVESGSELSSDTPDSSYAEHVDTPQTEASDEKQADHEDDDMAILKQMRAFRSTMPDEMEELDIDGDLDSDGSSKKSFLSKIVIPVAALLILGSFAFVRFRYPLVYSNLKLQARHTLAMVKVRLAGTSLDPGLSTTATPVLTSTASLVDSTGAIIVTSRGGDSPETTTVVWDSQGSSFPTSSGNIPFHSDGVTNGSLVSVVTSNDSDGNGKLINGAVSASVEGSGLNHSQNDVQTTDSSESSSGRSQKTTEHLVTNTSVAELSGVDSEYGVPENREMIVGTAFKKFIEAFANPDQRIDVFNVASSLSTSNETIRCICDKILNTTSDFKDPIHKVVHLMAKSEWKKAETACLKSLWGTKKGKERSQAYLLLARIRASQEHLEVALKTYKLAQKENPEGEYAILGIYRTYEALGQKKNGLTVVNRYLKDYHSQLLTELIAVPEEAEKNKDSNEASLNATNTGEVSGESRNLSSVSLIKRLISDSNKQKIDSAGNSKDSVPSVHDISVDSDNQVDSLVSPDDTSDTVASLPDDTSDTVASLPDDTSDTVASLPDDTSDTVASLPDDTSDTAASLPDDTSDTAASLPDDTSDTVASLPDDTSDTAASLPDDTSDTAASLPDDTSDTVASLPDDTSDTVASLPDDTSDTVASLPDDTSDIVVSLPDDTSDTVTSRPDDTNDTVATFPDDTSDTVTSLPDDTSGVDVMASVGATEVRELSDYTDLKGYTVDELIEAGKAHERSQEYALAVRYYKASLERDLEDSLRSSVMLDLAFCLRVEKKYGEALLYAGKAKKLGRKISPGLWILLNMQK